MPRKGDRRKGRRRRTSTTPVPQPASAAATGAVSASSGTTSSNRTAASSKASPQTRGRKTNNSQKGRLPPTKPAAAATNANSSTNGGSNGKKNGNGTATGAGCRGVKRPNKRPDYTSYTGDDQTVYKPGDYAYVDSQQNDQPYHICRILSFKGTRKDTVTAEVKWFYRVCELPEAVYYQLMEDRKQGEHAAAFELHFIRDRELFTAFNIDTHPAHFFRGKCFVKEFSDISDMSSYLTLENHFFYQHGYKPESRRMTKMDEFSFIPYSQQAVLPDYDPEGHHSQSESKEGLDSNKGQFDRYSTPEESSRGGETLMWKANIEDDNLLMYLRAARSVALHAGVCMHGQMRDGYMAASSDETTQQAFDVLHNQNYNTEKSLLDLIKKPIAGRLHRKKNWSKEHSLLFAKGMRQFGKNFRKIKKELLPNKEITELIEYYYYWKKTTAGLSSRSTRKQRKQIHIRMCRAMMKPEDTTPEPTEREFIDVSSGDEEDMEEDGEKCFSYHACRHCYSTESTSWHHSGSNKTILCHDCRTYFRKYSCMRPLTVKREPPEFMFKDYHLALAEESGRKTRNSNNVRQPRAGLRNGKIFSKSDSDEDEEGEGSDTSEFSSNDSIEVPVNNKRKELQPRRSLLDLLDSKTATVPKETPTIGGEEPKKEKAIKQEKTEERECGGASDEDGSRPSTLTEEGEQDEVEEGSRKSSEDRQSTSQSPDSSGEERTISHGPITATTPSASAPLAKEQQFVPELGPIPQQFLRVRNDSEATCARTDLVYVHPPPEERRALIQPQKTIPQHIPHLPFDNTSQQHTQSSQSPSTVTVPSTLPSHHPQHQQPKQVPTITTYEPHLPSGPSHFIGFPVPHMHAMTPTFPPGAGDPSFAMATMGVPRPFPAAFQASREEVLLWQQKQLEMASHGIAFQPAHLGGLHTADHAQQMVFQFPSPEEMPRLQRVGGGGGAPIHAAAMPEGVIPTPQFHQLVATPSVIMEAGHHNDGSARPPPPGMTLSLLPNMEAVQHQQLQLLAQQQQSQLMAILSNPEHVQELQRQYIMISQEMQKNPSILSNPAVQSIVAQYQQLEQYSVLQQQQELLIQQEILKQQQQQQQQQKYSHQPAAARPGVIMNLQHGK